MALCHSRRTVHVIAVRQLDGVAPVCAVRAAERVEERGRDRAVRHVCDHLVDERTRLEQFASLLPGEHA